jgi:hypothetical protein
MVPSYPFQQPERVFFNPYVPGEIWVTSFGNGMKTGTVTATGITEFANSYDNGNELYPNPAVNEINIKTDLKSGDKGLIIVRDITGRKLYEGELSSETKVDVSDFATGTYIANIIVNGNLVKSRKFVVLK